MPSDRTTRANDAANAPSSSRREFLKHSSLLAGAGTVAGTLSFAQSAHAAGGDELKVGLIGCGGRGTGAASQALKADPNVKLWAMGDAFADRLGLSLKSLRGIGRIKDKIDVPAERQFVGFDAFQQVIDSGVDVVLLCTPPHFRPQHLQAAVDAGKHVFAEKPVAVDAPGVRSVLATCEQAKAKGLSVVSGLCLRYSYGFKELIRRVHDGQIGAITSLEANDYRGAIWWKPRKPEWTDMHWQLRNWYYFTWLSGDFNVEQHVHFLDVCAWVMGGRYPVKAVGMGGRQVRRGEQFGNIYDHHSVVYEYDDGAKLYSNTRQMKGCFNEISAKAAGTAGRALLSERRKGLRIEKDTEPWIYDGPENNIYQTEHDEMFAAIRSGRPINNGDYMARSTMLAILGRMATYSGQEIAWEEAMNSEKKLGPESYEWGDLPTPPVAVPGVSKVL